jgi:hypothetical protein
MESQAIGSQPGGVSSIKLLVGVFITAVGILLTLDNLGMVDAHLYLAWWPLLLIAIGVVKIMGDGSRILGVALIIAGGWLTAYNLGYVRFTIFDAWPLILIAVGVGFVARAVGWKPELPASLGSSTTWGVLSERKVRETSSEFAGRRYVAFLGSCEIDLTDANITSSPAVIETIAVMGGVEVLVPYEWEIVGEVVPVMGGFEVKVRPSASTGKQLIVRGAAVMGGVNVKSAPGRRS